MRLHESILSAKHLKILMRRMLWQCYTLLYCCCLGGGGEYVLMANHKASPYKIVPCNSHSKSASALKTM